MTTRLFGEKVARREDPRLLRGEGRYVDDLGHGALAAAFVRSPHAHARITDIDVTDALDVDGLVAIYTYEDLPEKMAKPLPVLIPHPALYAPRTPYALANGEVNHVGEAVAMVVARDRYVAEDAAERVQVAYEFLDPVVDLEEAARAERAVHDEVPDNVAAHLVQEVGDARAAIAAAPHVLEFRLDIERSASMPLEGRGVYARWDADDERLRAYSSTQTSTSVRAAVANALDLADAQVEVIAPDVGGGFGVKIVHPWPEELLVPWAAKTLGREVKWVEDRREHFVASAHERGQVHHVRVGFDSDGTILGLDVQFLHDNGAYTPYGIIVPIITSTQLPGPYKLGAYRVEFSSVYTNTVLVTPYRGAGRPQAVFAMERTVDKIAAHLGTGRAEVRAANLIQPDEMPYDLGLTFQDGRPAIYDSGDFPATLATVKQLVGWDEFTKEQGGGETGDGRWLGIGLAAYVEGTGVGPYEGAHVHVETNGRVMVSTGLTSQGQGHQTAFAQIVANELGVPFDDVHVTTGDTRRFGYAVGTFASRAAVMSGNAIALAARKVREKALRIAADALEANPDDLEITDGVVQVRGSPEAQIELKHVAVLSNPLRYSFSEEAQAATQFTLRADDGPPVPEGEEPGLEGKDYYSPTQSTFANGMHACVVAIDPETADVEILRYGVVHDCGHLINPTIVEGQIHGGVAQGVAGALYERMAYDEHGQLQNASFMDFLMPYATEVPRVDIDHLETPTPLNPLGIKGAGEAGVIPGAAVLASAIEDACGIEINRMPLSPSELWELVRQHDGSTTAGRGAGGDDGSDGESSEGASA